MDHRREELSIGLITIPEIPKAVRATNPKRRVTPQSKALRAGQHRVLQISYDRLTTHIGYDILRAEVPQ